MPNLPLKTDGPERFRGGHQCVLHHEGQKTGISDTCCCCNPCLYERPLRSSETHEATREGPCRCVPQLICFTFTPTGTTNSPCCKGISTPVLAGYSGDGKTRYAVAFSDTVDLELTIEGGAVNLDNSREPGFWRLYSEGLGIDQTYIIDHRDSVVCLSPPAIEITGVTVNECVGTITFTDYQAEKVPFVNRQLIRQDDAILNELICSCTHVARVLCVWGRRHVGGPIEAVEFTWNEDFGDRWEYLPPCGLRTADLEVIYLRSDYAGNCYLELDFERAGPWTNDWADPPNTLGVDPYEVREGLLPIRFCSCGLRVQSSSTGERFVHINAGYCAKFKYKCGTCRCVPTYLCVFGEIEGESVQFTATWNGEKWTGAWGVGNNPIAFTLGNGNCLGPPADTDDSTVCAISVEGDFTLPFVVSDAVECGKFFATEVQSAYDSNYPNIFNWLWITASFCGCSVSTCGICSQACGASPLVIHADLECIITVVEGADDPYPEYVECNLSVTMYYWQRWALVGETHVLQCGYVGFTLIDGGYIGASITENSQFQLIRHRYATGVTETIDTSNIVFYYQSCNPLYWESDWVGGPGHPQLCPWGPEVVYSPESSSLIRVNILE